MILVHVKSHYSTGLGTASVEDLVAGAAAHGVDALALTDLENLYGQLRFHDVCGRHGIQAITGVELRPGFDGRRHAGTKAGRLVLLARDGAGYRNLCRIVTRRRIRAGTTSPAATGVYPVSSIMGVTEGLLAMTDHVPTLERLLADDVLPASAVRLLLVRPGSGASAEADVVAAARRHRVPLVADLDVVMLENADHALHRLLVAIRMSRSVRDAAVLAAVEPADRAMLDSTAVAKLFADRPSAIEGARHIAKACTLDLRQQDRIRIPAASGTDGSPEKRLGAVCRAALQAGRREGRWSGDAYPERLEHEMGVISGLGFASYFLAVSDIVRITRERGIQTSGRGSAAGSLVAHVLGITEIDPLAHGLYFERFLHAGRLEPPDIDVDVDSNRRDELIEWVRHRFGRERVAMVSTHHTYQRRTALRDGLRALGLSPSAVIRIASRLPPDDIADAVTERERFRVIENADGADESEAVSAADYLAPALRSWLPEIDRLVGKPRHISVHPGGVVIGPDAIQDHVPLQRAPGGTVVTQYDMSSIERAGLLKIDLLGNRALAQLDEAIQLLPDPGEDVRVAALQTGGAAAIPEDDAETLRRLDHAETIGCWQLESPVVRSVLRRLPVHDIEDVTAALAVVRPGAAAGGAKETFLRCARGLEPAHDLHEHVASQLERTHGVPLYEEDILYILHRLGGVSLTHADELRAMLVRLDENAAELHELGETFIRRAAASGHDADAARLAWDAAARFAAYSFSKAHAASYAVVAFRAAYLKTHFPTEFGCALLNNYGGMYPRRTIAADIERQGVRVLPPSVNRSEFPCSIERTGHTRVVRTGLALLGRLRRKTARALLQSRVDKGAFHDVNDLLERVPLSTAEMSALILTGACDDLAPLSAEGYPFVHDALLAGLRGELSQDAFRQRLEEIARLSRDEARARSLDRYCALVRIRNELEYLEMHVTDHPMRVLRADADSLGCVPTRELPARVGRFVRVAGVVAAARRVRSRRGDVMQFITLEDEHGTIEATVFPDVYRRLGNRVVTPGPFLVAGRLLEEDGDLQIAVSQLDPFHQRPRP